MVKVVHDEAEPNEASGSVLDAIVSDFGPALTRFLGTSHGLSAATITRLTKD